MKRYWKKWHLQKGDAISFTHNGNVVEGQFRRIWNDYLLVETGKEMWRVIPHSVVTVRNKTVLPVVCQK
jgi:hypothetical protein